MIAAGVYKMAGSNIPGELRELARWVHLDPESTFFIQLTEKLRQITPDNVRWIAGGTGFYGLFSLFEGMGLILRVSWIGWLAIGESAFFIPIEVYELLGGFSVTLTVILCLNVLIVLYLYRNRVRLFHPTPPAADETIVQA